MFFRFLGFIHFDNKKNPHCAVKLGGDCGLLLS